MRQIIKQSSKLEFWDMKFERKNKRKKKSLAFSQEITTAIIKFHISFWGTSRITQWKRRREEKKEKKLLSNINHCLAWEFFGWKFTFQHVIISEEKKKIKEKEEANYGSSPKSSPLLDVVLVSLSITSKITFYLNIQRNKTEVCCTIFPFSLVWCCSNLSIRLNEWHKKSTWNEKKKRIEREETKSIGVFDMLFKIDFHL